MMMKKMLRTAALTVALLSAACGAAWLGNISPVDAYMYGIYDDYPTDGPALYPMYMSDGVHLAYTQMNSGIYVDTTSAYTVSQKGPWVELAANVINWNKTNGYQSIKEEMYLFNTGTDTMYTISNGKMYEIRYSRYPGVSPSEADMRAASKAMLIWHTVMGTDWQWKH